jgi:hypothetical protein
MARRFSGSSVSRKMKLHHSWWFLPLYLHYLWHFLNILISNFLYTSGFIWCYFDRLWCWLLVQHLFLYVCRVLKSLLCIKYLWKALYVVGNEVFVYISGSGLRCWKLLNTFIFCLEWDNAFSFHLHLLCSDRDYYIVHGRFSLLAGWIKVLTATAKTQ